ncbi:MAG: hypothetical protein Q4P71_03260 [Actinomycetaceae bacterium]|nr:hypothetical protein [Actinomycetaceae bacterium]
MALSSHIASGEAEASTPRPDLTCPRLVLSTTSDELVACDWRPRYRDRRIYSPTPHVDSAVRELDQAITLLAAIDMHWSGTSSDIARARIEHLKSFLAHSRNEAVATRVLCAAAETAERQRLVAALAGWI